MTAPPDNLAQMRGFVSQVQAEGRLELLDQFVHPEFCDHPLDGSRAVGRDVASQAVQGLHATVADVKIEIVHMFEHDGVVATHKIIRGRQVGPWMGEEGTGQPFQLRVMDFIRFRDGLMIEHWSTFQPLK